VNVEAENNWSDQTLVHKVLRGDTQAFSRIINHTEPLVAQIVSKMIPDAEDRKDLAQDIYLKAFHKLDSFRFQSKLSTWIAQIAYHACFSFLKKKKLVLLDSMGDEEESDSWIEAHDKTVNIFDKEPERLLHQTELSKILKTGLTTLPPVYQTLLTLYHNEELSYAEIAYITELPEGTVKSYLFRARKALKDHLLLTYERDAL